MDTSLVISGAIVLGAGGIFHLLENRIPLEKVDRSKFLKFDLVVVSIIAIVVAALTIWLLDGVVKEWLDSTIGGFDTLTSLPILARVSLALIIGDFGYYIVHRLMHTNVLWRTHVFHHSIQEIYWFSGLRTSALNSLFIRMPYLVALCLFSIPASILAIVAISLGVINFWVHSNLEVSLGPLNYILITPSFHRVHHSMAEEALNRNFGNILSCWDYMFKTAVKPTKYLNNSKKGFDVETNDVPSQMFGL